MGSIRRKKDMGCLKSQTYSIKRQNVILPVEIDTIVVEH